MAHFGYGSWLRLFVARLEGDQAAIDAEFRQVVHSRITSADWMALFMAEFMGNPHTLATTDEGDESVSHWSVGDDVEEGSVDASSEEEEQPARRSEGSRSAGAQRVEVEKEQPRYRTQGES